MQPRTLGIDEQLHVLDVFRAQRHPAPHLLANRRKFLVVNGALLALGSRVHGRRRESMEQRMLRACDEARAERLQAGGNFGECVCRGEIAGVIPQDRQNHEPVCFERPVAASVDDSRARGLV